MDTALPQKFPFILDRNLAEANCTENHVCTSCDTVVLASLKFLPILLFGNITDAVARRLFCECKRHFGPQFCLQYILIYSIYIYSIYIYILYIYILLYHRICIPGARRCCRLRLGQQFILPNCRRNSGQGYEPKNIQSFWQHQTGGSS